MLLMVGLPVFGRTHAMTKLHCISGLLLLISFSIEAAALKLPTLKAGPVTYSDVTVIGANATDLYFTHAKGIGNVKLKYVNAELQKRFNYDSKAATEAERKQLEADNLYQSAVVSNMAFLAKQVQAARINATNVVEPLVDPISDKSLLGKAAPALEFDKWLQDKPETEGKYVLIAFWAPWSTASIRVIPDLNSLQKKFSKRLVVIGVSPSEVEEMPKVDFVCATDTNSKFTTAAGVVSVPSVLLVDPKGVVRYQGHPAALSEKKLDALFAQQLQ